MSTPSVRAVLVTDGRSEHLPATLAALADLDEPPTEFHLVLLGDADAVLPDGLEVVATTSTATTYAQGVADVLARNPSRGDELLWLLHDDTAPAPDALTRLLATASKRPRAAVVGAAHVRWRDASRLVNLGTTVSRVGARRIGMVVEGDINQGQHDWREDVLAVSLAGALVRREAWEALGGIDPGYAGFGDSLEFCRRAWASGRDVVIEPAAVVRHAQDSLYGIRAQRQVRAATHLRRRVSEWHHAFAWAPWWLVPILVVMVPASVVARVPVRIAQNTPRIALAELLVPVALAARVPAIARTAASHRTVGATGAIETRLLATPRQVFDAVRHRELRGFDTLRASRAPSDIVRAEIARARGMQRLSLLATAVLGVAAAAAVGVTWIRALVVGDMITGPGVGTTSLSFDAVWSRTWTGLSSAGLGSPGIDGAFAGLMAPLALAPGGLRVGLGVFLVAAPLLAVLVGWWAGGHATRGPWMRAGIALIYGLWPPFLEAVFDARVGAVVAHIAVAAAAMATARAVGWRRGEVVGDREEVDAPAPSPSAALAASLALTAATVAQPVLLVPTLVVLACLGAVAGRFRRRVWGIAAVPVVVGLPGVVAAFRVGGSASDVMAVLAREPGPAAGFDGDAWRGALGLADPSRWAPSLQGAGAFSVLLTCVCVAAGMAALASRAAMRVAVTGVGVAAAGLVVAAWSTSSTVVWPDLAGGSSATGWPTAGSSLVILGLLVAAAGAHGSLMTVLGKRAAIARVAAAAVAMLGTGASLGVVTFLAWPGAERGSATIADARVLPLAVPLDQEGPYRQRVLVLSQHDDGTVAFSVLANDGSSNAAGRADRGPSGSSLAALSSSTIGIDVLAPTVAEAVTSGSADLAELREWGIGTVVVTAGGDRIRSALDQNSNVALVGGSARGTAYRLEGGEAPIAWIESGDERASLRSARTSGATAEVPVLGGTLIIAVPAGGGWTAWADGKELATSVDERGRASFVVPPGSDRVHYEYRDPAQRWWWWAGAIAVAWALIGAVPLKRSREVSP